MKTLVSLPSALFSSSGDILLKNEFTECFVSADPPERLLGSGGGSAWLLSEYWKTSRQKNNFISFVNKEKKILIHAGGQSRRLPAYATSGKILMPIPVYRWKAGQRIDQSLLDIQLSFYRNIVERTGAYQNTLIASGDVVLRCDALPSSLPDADVVCIATWIEPSVATGHGVLFARKETPEILDFMLQKPSAQKIEELLATHVFMMDTGCWVLSDHAVEVLMKKCGWNGSSYAENLPWYYDLYLSFGEALGLCPRKPDAEVSLLSCALVNPEGGEFYHYGTTRELVSSTGKIQNLVTDPRCIYQKRVKTHPSLFVQNAEVGVEWKPDMRNIWVENSCVPASWTLRRDTVVTGVPVNSWNVSIPEGVCIDIVPVGERGFCLRPYGMDDAFRGCVGEADTLWMGSSLSAWFGKRGLDWQKTGIDGTCDIQTAHLFPVLDKENFEKYGDRLLKWMMEGILDEEMRSLWLHAERLSACDILVHANMERLFEQRAQFRKGNLVRLAENYAKSVFYQSDLFHMAQLYNNYKLDLPSPVSENAGYILRMRDSMFRSQVLKLSGESGEMDERVAFAALRQAIVSTVGRVQPAYDIVPDQIVWGRSPARIDLAGGWSDTPPYSMYSGGSVVDIAIDLNGQQPIQTYIRKVSEPSFMLRSIDTGVAEKVTTYEQLASYSAVGSSFSIPKAALCLAGFCPQFSVSQYDTLERQLGDMGGGLEITLLAAIPKGSGLGTSSILASTLLGALSDVCSLGWTKEQICYRTLALEQLLTTGGGWQDQYGAVYGGVKLLESSSGLQDSVQVRRLPRDIYTESNTAGLWLLYYTGITRVAKNILGDIVRGMFLNKGETLALLDEIKKHAYAMADAIQFGDYRKAGQLIRHSWQLNCELDRDTTSPEIETILSCIDEYAWGYKLPGAGGGGYMLICAKDIDAVPRIQKALNTDPINDRARFVRMSLDMNGLQISRS